MAVGIEMVYQFKDNARLAGVTAQTAGERLEQIREKHDGRLTPRLVLADARPKGSPLHLAFEWNDTTAAEAYRLDQARYMIRSITIVIENAPVVRAFVSVIQNTDDEKTYTHIVAAMESPQLREQVVADAKVEMQRWRKRYATLKEFDSVFKAIDDLDIQ